MNGIYKRLRKTFLFRMLLIGLGLLITGLYGCGDATEPDETQETGQVVISLTDDAGDFINYKVKVVSLTLIKANGAIVETLPLETDVDFAQYTDMSEFLTAATVPSGVYTKARLKLDYSEADIIVENEAGNAVPVDSIEDEDGNSFETIEVSVRLSDHNRLVIAPGIPAHLSFDFDLNASNEVVFEDDESITLTVHPVLLAEVDVETSRVHRVRGSLKSVSVNDNSFKVIIRPFFHVLSHGNERFGILKVISKDTTVYEINGEQFEGQAGLCELDQQTPLTAIIAIGELLFNPPRFEAREVYAGSSVPGGENDVITGNVIARSGNNLTVRGATLFRSNGSVIFNSTQIILFGEDTTVSHQLSADPGSTDDISVGQKIMVFGVLNAEENQINATSGHVRLLLTTLKGIVVNNATDSRLVVDLKSIDGRRTGLFDFSGTGSDLVNDADPENYEINTGDLALDDFGAGTPVKIRGFVNKFGMAPPDFTAQTVVGVANAQAILKAGWFPAEPEAFETLNSDNIIFNPDKYGYLHHVFQAGVITDLESFENGAQLIPPESGFGIFAIKQNRMVQVHTSFENFSDDLAERLAENAAVKHLTGVGAFDSNSAVLTSRKIFIRLF